VGWNHGRSLGADTSDQRQERAVRETLTNREKLIEIMCTRIPGASPYWAAKAADLMLSSGWRKLTPEDIEFFEKPIASNEATR